MSTVNAKVKTAIYLIFGFTALNVLAYLASRAVNNDEVREIAERDRKSVV